MNERKKQEISVLKNTTSINILKILKPTNKTYLSKHYTSFQLVNQNN